MGHLTHFKRLAIIPIFLVGLSSADVFAVELSSKDIDLLVVRAMEKLNTPGMAVAVVKDDEVVHAAGYGLRDVRHADPVNVDTIFQIASLTKAFTAFALGLLVDEGKLHWDDRVIDHLPEFAMYDPWVTREFTIRDLLTHRSGLGLGAGDLLFWPNSDSTRAEIIEAMRHLKPETSFRTAYAYDNLLYVVAGEVVSARAGIPWEDFVEQQILRPLGMSDCRALPDRVSSSKNRATPHMLVEGEFQPTFFSGGGATAAAGAINCSAAGMAKWAMMHLAGGELPDGKRLISEETHAEIWKPVTLIPVNEKDPTVTESRTHFIAYGLGWGLRDFFGYLHVSHGGALQGMTSHFALLPELNVAVIALTNQWGRSTRAVTSQILNAYVADGPEDWVEIFARSESERSDDAQKEVEKAFAARDESSKPSLPLAAYAGEYMDPWYGTVAVEHDGEHLIMRFSRSTLLVGPLEHFQYNTFIARWNDRSLFADAYATFSMGADGKVESIQMRPVSPDTDFSYDFHDLDLRRHSSNQ